MAANKQVQPDPGEEKRQKYEKPLLRTIELSLDETMAEGCKLGTDPVCLANFEAGS